jgi:hypothetical protein
MRHSCLFIPRFAAYNSPSSPEHACTEIIFSVEESPKGGFQARALGFSIFTEADSLDELKSMIRNVVSCRVPHVSVLHVGFFSKSPRHQFF